MNTKIMVRYLEEFWTGLALMLVALVYAVCFAISIAVIYSGINSASVLIVALGALMFMAVIEPVACAGSSIREWMSSHATIEKVDCPPPNARRFYTEGRVLEIETGPVEISSKDSADG